MIAERRLAAIVVVCVALVLAGCSSSSAKKSAPTSRSTSVSVAPSTPASASFTPPTPARIAAADQLYVSIGDSYAAGYQPVAPRKGSTTRNGFAYQVVTDARAKGYHFTLANFACSGATTTSVIKTPGCDPKNLGPGATSYDTKTQAVAAQDFLRKHRGQVGLITVSVGGNDVTSCKDAGANITACLSAALGKLKTNLATLLAGLRAAAGPATRIIGLTYPDVFLGEALSKDPAKRNLANLSVLAFQSFINPQLKTSYQSFGATFLDVTAATGAYGSQSATTTLPPYGAIPVPVAKICKLTYYCQFGDIHPRTDGYALIADLVTATLPQH